MIDPDRKKRLQELKDQPREMVLVADGDAFVVSLEAQIAKLQEIMGQPVSLNDIDGLIAQLSGVGSVAEQVRGLKDAIQAVVDKQMPETVGVVGLSDIVKAIKEIKPSEATVKVDFASQKSLKGIMLGLDGVIKAIEENKLSLSQKPGDFIPTRRVVKIGSQYLFDDNPHGGGGSGGSSVSAVTIADGSDAAIGSTTDAAVDTDTTGTVSGKLRGLVKLMVNLLSRWPASLGQKAKTASLPVVIASDQDALSVSPVVTYYAVEAQQDATYDYYAFALPGTALASAAWQAKRVESDGTTKWADGNANFDNVATNLSGLSYS